MTPRRRSGNRTICQPQAPLLWAPDHLRSLWEVENRHAMGRAEGERSLVSSKEESEADAMSLGKPLVSEHLRNMTVPPDWAFPDVRMAISVSRLLDDWSPQQLLAEIMVTMVNQFRTKVVKFILGGRNSGQRLGHWPGKHRPKRSA
jgi:hypothetical protein